MKRMLVGMFLILLTFSFSISFDEIKKDLDFLKDAMSEKHADFFINYERDDFYNDIDKLKDNLEGKNIYEINYSIQEILAKANDGHTMVAGIFSNERDKNYPFELVYYDGIYVRALPKKFEKYLGWKVNSINFIKIEEIIKRVDRLSNEDNIYGLKKNFENIINKLYALQYLDISSNNQVTLSLEKNGKRANIIIKANDKEKTYLPRAGWTNNKGHQNEAFWLANFSDIENGLYFQYNQCYSKEVYEKLKKMEGFESLEESNMKNYPSVEERFEKFFEENKNNYDFVVIDLRNNSGGSVIPTMYMLIEFSTKSQLLNSNYYVLTDRTTFSSGVLTTYMFDKFLNATIVGEPPSGSPNHSTEVKSIHLPNTKITIRYPTKKGNLTEMEGNVYEMDYLIEPSFEDYMGKDKMMYKILELEGLM